MLRKGWSTSTARGANTQGCTKYLSFGVAGTTKREYCAGHAKEGIVDLTNPRKCTFEGRGRREAGGVCLLKQRMLFRFYVLLTFMSSCSAATNGEQHAWSYPGFAFAAWRACENAIWSINVWPTASSNRSAGQWAEFSPAALNPGLQPPLLCTWQRLEVEKTTTTVQLLLPWPASFVRTHINPQGRVC